MSMSIVREMSSNEGSEDVQNHENTTGHVAPKGNHYFFMYDDNLLSYSSITDKKVVVSQPRSSFT